jgi:hypothetical protein
MKILFPQGKQRLIKRLKEQAGIRNGNRFTSVKFTEVAKAVGIAPRSLMRGRGFFVDERAKKNTKEAL